MLSETFTQDAGLETQAQQNNISVGKAALIQGVLALNSGLDFNDLAALSVEELQQMRETGAPGMPIGRAQAAYAAQEYAGVLEVSAITYEVDPELDEYPPHYEVELYTAFGEYEYMVDAYTGEILAGPANILENAFGSTPVTSSDSLGGAGIGIQGAKAAALAAAGLTEGEVTALTVKGDYDDGRLEYEVAFWYNSTEYEYDIDGTTGAVLKQEQEAHASAPSSGDVISPEAARDAALAHAGVGLGDVYELEVEAELDEWIPCYKVEFKSGGMEYEYEVHASTGEILTVEKDWD